MTGSHSASLKIYWVLAVCRSIAIRSGLIDHLLLFRKLLQLVVLSGRKVIYLTSNLFTINKKIKK